MHIMTETLNNVCIKTINAVIMKQIERKSTFAIYLSMVSL